MTGQFFPVMKAFRTVIEWRTTAWWRSRSAKGLSEDPANATCWKHKLGFSQQRRNVGYTYGKMGWAERRLDTIMESGFSQEDRRGFLLLKMIRLTSMQTKKVGGILFKKARDVDPLIIAIDYWLSGQGIELVIRSDGKTVVDWINGKVKQKTPSRIIDNVQLQFMDWWRKGVDLSRRTGDWAVHVFREHNTGGLSIGQVWS